jgi:hypothetical protein
MKPTSLGLKTQYATSTLFLVHPRADRLDEGRRLAAPVVGASERDQTLARRGAHPDVLELLPPEGKERVGIDSVREAVRASQFAPVQGERKVCLVPFAEALTVEAANALLKTLEEPPREMAFVLLAGHTADLLPTIVSRSRIVRLTSAGPTEALERLHALGYEEADARWLTSVARRDGEIDRFLERRVDVPQLRRAAEERVASLSPSEVALACVEGESALRRLSLFRFLDLARERDAELLTSGVRLLASQTRETLFSWLQELLEAAFERARDAEEVASPEAARRRAACRAVEAAHRVLVTYAPTEAILVSLILSIGGAGDGS